jgi:hypothetical protein
MTLECVIVSSNKKHYLLFDYVYKLDTGYSTIQSLCWKYTGITCSVGYVKLKCSW